MQEKLPEPYMYVPIDKFFHMYPDKFLNPTNRKGALVLECLIPAVLSGLHRSIAALAQSGNNVLVDHLLQEDGLLQECVESSARLDVLFVGVRCPLEIAEQCESEREDRNIGTARYQFERVHIHDLYDLEIDTSLLSVDECMARIIEQIGNKPKRVSLSKISGEIYDYCQCPSHVRSTLTQRAPDGWRSPRFQVFCVAWSWFRQNGFVSPPTSW